MSDAVKVTKPALKRHEDVAKDANTDPISLPAGSYDLSELHGAAEAKPEDRAAEVEKVNKTFTERPEPGVPRGSKRVDVVDEVTGVKESRVVTKTEKEREDAPVSEPTTSPSDKPTLSTGETAEKPTEPETVSTTEKSTKPSAGGSKSE